MHVFGLLDSIEVPFCFQKRAAWINLLLADNKMRLFILNGETPLLFTNCVTSWLRYLPFILVYLQLLEGNMSGYSNLSLGRFCSYIKLVSENQAQLFPQTINDQLRRFVLDFLNSWLPIVDKCTTVETSSSYSTTGPLSVISLCGLGDK